MFLSCDISVISSPAIFSNETFFPVTEASPVVVDYFLQDPSSVDCRCRDSVVVGQALRFVLIP